jgi:membrane protein YqaA with SNARE-associated domain
MPVITGNTRAGKAERYLQEKQSNETPQPVSQAPPVKRSSTPATKVKQPFTPPNKRKKPKKQLTPAEKRKRYLKWAFWLIVAIILYFSFGWIQEQVFTLLQSNPTVWAMYKAIETEIASRSLLGLFYAAFFGALFFLALPVELIFIYYLNLNYYFVQILFITLVGNLLGIAVDYFFGWLIGPKVLQWFMKKETYETFQRKIRKAGAFIILVGNVIPFPIEPFTVFLGAVRYGFLRLMLYTFIGKMLKFGMLWLGYKYFVQFVGPHIATVNLPWFIDLIKSSFGG